MQTFLNELGISRLIRYSYGGFLLLFIVSIINPEIVKSIINSLGTIISILVILNIGASIFVIHRYVLVEIFEFPLIDCIHNVIDYFHKNTGADSTSPFKYIKSLGVKKGNSRAAYLAIRKEFFDSEKRKNVDIIHSELHILYITAEETLLTGIYLLYWDNQFHYIYLFTLSIIFALSAIIADIKQLQLECHSLKIKNSEGKLRSFLLEIGYL